MKSMLLRPAARGGGFVLLVGVLVLLAGHPAPADIVKGAGLQRQLAQAKSSKTSAAPRTEAGRRPAGSPTNQAGDETIAVTTGSHIPTTISKRGQITHSAQNLQVLDRRQLERTGASSVSEAIRRLVP
jgi:hypothetical protein